MPCPTLTILRDLKAAAAAGAGLALTPTEVQERLAEAERADLEASITTLEERWSREARTQ